MYSKEYDEASEIFNQALLHVDKVSDLAVSVFWLVIPSLALFITLPLLLKQGFHFYTSMSLSILITIACYGVMVFVLNNFGIKL